MAESDQTQDAGGGSASEKAAALREEALRALEALPKIRLAHHATLRRAIPNTDTTEAAFREPAALNGVVNIYGQPPIFFPDEDSQRAGFTPLFVATLGGRVTNERFKPYDGRRFHYLTGVKTEGGEAVELDVDSAQEATRVVLQQFTGLYKPVEEKGA